MHDRSYLFEPPVHCPDLLLGELCLLEEVVELNGLLVLGGQTLGNKVLRRKTSEARGRLIITLCINLHI